MYDNLDKVSYFCHEKIIELYQNYRTQHSERSPVIDEVAIAYNKGQINAFLEVHKLTQKLSNKNMIDLLHKMRGPCRDRTKKILDDAIKHIENKSGID